jgi:hypothetical protein
MAAKPIAIIPKVEGSANRRCRARIAKLTKFSGYRNRRNKILIAFLVKKIMDIMRTDDSA